MKTLKIPNNVHQELKRFVANNDKETISDFAGFAIMNELKTRGHKFLKPKKLPLSKDYINSPIIKIQK